VIKLYVIPSYPRFNFYARCNARVGTEREPERNKKIRKTDGKESRVNVVITDGDYTIVLDFTDSRRFIEPGTNAQDRDCTAVMKLVEDKKLRNAKLAILAIRYDAALSDKAYQACKDNKVIVIVMTCTGMTPLENVIEINKNDSELYDVKIGLTPAVFEKFMTDENAQIIKKACFGADSNYNHDTATNTVNMKKSVCLKRQMSIKFL